MARILCSISGIEFKCEHFPIALHAGEYYHPIFAVPTKRLFPYYNKWLAPTPESALTKTDSFLLFAALLKATELVEFRQPIRQCTTTNQIVASNMSRLFAVAWKLNEITHPSLLKLIPKVAITSDTATLENISSWIAIWNEAFENFASGLRNEELRSQIQRKEAALERLIKNPAIHPVKYAAILAQWATDAAAFPDHTATYWQEVIIKCHTDTSLISIPLVDIEELLEHCEEQLDLGSIYSHHLFATLRTAQDTIRGFFGIGVPTAFRLLTPSDSVETANLDILLATAPTREPARSEYATEFAFIKARMKWNLVQNQRQAEEESQS